MENLKLTTFKSSLATTFKFQGHFVIKKDILLYGYRYMILYIPKHTNYINLYFRTNKPTALRDTLFFHTHLKPALFCGINSTVTSVDLTSLSPHSHEVKKQPSSSSLFPHKLMVVRQSACWESWRCCWVSKAANELRATRHFPHTSTFCRDDEPDTNWPNLPAGRTLIVTGSDPSTQQSTITPSRC